MNSELQCEPDASDPNHSSSDSKCLPACVTPSPACCPFTERVTTRGCRQFLCQLKGEVFVMDLKVKPRVATQAGVSVMPHNGMLLRFGGF